ncbi:hypothetical protein RhiirB3_437633 [Rhizophagus irregularis]|nr:hypothetical protein RhiirB3_437633 [Rhizophagus irregularis]
MSDVACENCSKKYIKVFYEWCKQCETNKLRKNFANWTSGNDKIDNFIQEKQLEINNSRDIVCEWIPYNKFLDIKEVDKDDISTIYSAKWEYGPLKWNNYIEFLNEVKIYSTNFNIFGISQNPDTKGYIIALQNNYSYCIKCNYVYTNVSYKWCKGCETNKLITNWTSGNKKIDNFIQEKQLEINSLQDIVFEWIPYNKFLDIEEVDKDDFSTVYSAKWEDGPLEWNSNSRKYIRNPTEIELKLKYSHNLQNVVEFLNEVKVFSTNFEIFGISQNPDTKSYIMVLQDKDYYCILCKSKKIYTDENYKWCKQCEINKLRKNFTNWISENETIDSFIQEKQLEVSYYNDIIFEWIPYNQFNDIKEIGMHDHITVYSAKWKDGPLVYDKNIRKYKRNPDELVRLKCPLFKQESLTLFKKLLLLFKEQNTTNEFLNKVKRYFMVNSNKMYGISQDPNSKEYLVILNGSCVKCGEIYINILYGWCPCQINSSLYYWPKSGNKQIDNFIKKVQLKICKYDDIVFGWIPYNQFIDVKEIGQSDFTTIYLAKWKDGPLEYNINTMQYERDPNRAITLKCLNNTRNMINEFLDKVKVNSIVKGSNVLNNIYGISQNPDTGNYIMVLHDKYFEKYFEGHCIKCDRIYADIRNKWCKSCQIDYFKKFFISINKEIDNFIQEMQLKINNHDDIVFEWIPYNQFNDIKRIVKGGFATVYSAIWKDGLLKYDINKNQYIRNSNTKVALKYLYNSQNITSEFLYEVKAYSINNSGKILKVYGISQDPNTKDFIMVLQYAEGRNFDYWIYNNYKYFNWLSKLKILNDIICGLKEIHQKQMVHHDFHVGNILFNEIFVISSNIKIYISDMGLCREVGNIDKTTIYGVMPYVAPEVLRGKPYTLSADIYSFGMIMYFVATEKQPFANCAHDELLALDICKGIRPEINEPEAPKCYIDLMKKCWDTDPNNRPDTIKVEDSIRFLYNSYFGHGSINKDYEIEKQFKEAETYRRNNLSFFKYIQLDTHPQAIYTSRLLNPFTKDLEKYDKSECLECEILN